MKIELKVDAPIVSCFLQWFILINQLLDTLWRPPAVKKGKRDFVIGNNKKKRRNVQFLFLSLLPNHISLDSVRKAEATLCILSQEIHSSGEESNWPLLKELKKKGELAPRISCMSNCNAQGGKALTNPTESAQK